MAAWAPSDLDGWFPKRRVGSWRTLWLNAFLRVTKRNFFCFQSSKRLLTQTKLNLDQRSKVGVQEASGWIGPHCKISYHHNLPSVHNNWVYVLNPFHLLSVAWRWLSRTVKGSESLPYLQVNKLTCHNFLNARVFLVRNKGPFNIRINCCKSRNVFCATFKLRFPQATWLR